MNILLTIVLISSACVLADNYVNLTALIENGDIDAAQDAAYVNHTAFQNVKSYSGFFEVNPKFNSRMFFWYIEAGENAAEAPIILWLQGGPGDTSFRGIFVENGPFEIVDGQIRKRLYSWHDSYNLLYIDSPVGAGFSTTNGGYAENMTAVTRDLYEALQQFFKLFPGYNNNEFYVAGESYSGKFVPAMCKKIHDENQDGIKINLKGFMIGNGLVDPLNQMKVGEFLYQLGFIDSNELNQFKEFEEEIVYSISNENYIYANVLFQEMLSGSYASLFMNLTGFDNVYNFIDWKEVDNTYSKLEKMFEIPNLKSALHLSSNSSIPSSAQVGYELREDYAQSMAPVLAELLSHYRGLIYHGMRDIIISFRSTMDFISKMKFTGSDEFKAAKKNQFRFDDELEGYTKSGGNLTVVAIRKAGHYAVTDQPKLMVYVIDKFIRKQMF